MKSCLIYTNILRYSNVFKSITRSVHDIKNDIINDKLQLGSVPKYETKLIKTAIIGVPNAGKSTLINSITDRKVCPASNKVHTTRKQTHAILTEDLTQVVFLDTPGIVSDAEQKKYKLEKAFEKDCRKSLLEADVIGVIHDISNVWTRERLDIKIIKLLEKYNRKPSFLVLNKIDALKSKRKLLDITRILTEGCLNSVPFIATKHFTNLNENRGWRNFNEIFMVSALECDGVQEIKNYLMENAHPAEWMYPAEQWTDHSPDDIILRTVKATLLDFLPQEIPYRLKTQMELFEMLDDGTINAVVLVHCPVERIRNLVVGTGDGKLRQITEKAQKDVMQTFDQPVRLRIVVSNVNKKDK